MARTRGSAARDWMVVEADESDGSFLRLDGTIAVVTNIDPEHLDHYGSFDAVQGRLRRVRRECAFLRRGLALRRSSRGAGDHPAGARPAGRHLRLRRAGRRARRQCRSPFPGGNRFDVVAAQPRRRGPADRGHRAADAGPPQCPECARRDRRRRRARHPRRGDRAAASTNSAASSGASPRSARSTASTIIDDYGHHPVEIRAVLSAAREGAQGRVIAVVQPHRFTRLRRPDGRVPAAPSTMPTWSSRAGLCGRRGSRSRASITRRWSRASSSAATVGAQAVADADDVCRQLRDLAAPGDMVICLGAGDITKWAAGLADGIRKARAAA